MMFSTIQDVPGFRLVGIGGCYGHLWADTVASKYLVPLGPTLNISYPLVN